MASGSEPVDVGGDPVQPTLSRMTSDPVHGCQVRDDEGNDQAGDELRPRGDALFAVSRRRDRPGASRCSPSSTARGGDEHGKGQTAHDEGVDQVALVPHPVELQKVVAAREDHESPRECSVGDEHEERQPALSAQRHQDRHRRHDNHGDEDELGATRRAQGLCDGRKAPPRSPEECRGHQIPEGITVGSRERPATCRCGRVTGVSLIGFARSRSDVGDGVARGHRDQDQQGAFDASPDAPGRRPGVAKTSTPASGITSRMAFCHRKSPSAKLSDQADQARAVAEPGETRGEQDGQGHRSQQGEALQGGRPPDRGLQRAGG